LCDDGASGLCYSGGASASSVGHWEGGSGGRGLEALTLPVQLLFVTCLRQPCNIKEKY